MVDPFFRHEIHTNLEIVVASRPITVSHGSGDPSVVDVAGDRDLVVIGDEVTIVGAIPLQHPSSGLNGGAGANVTIVARVLGGQAGVLKTSGGNGETSNNVLTVDPRKGQPGNPGADAWQKGQTGNWGHSTGSFTFDFEDPTPCNPPAGDGESASKHDPAKPAPGPPPSDIPAFNTWAAQVRAGQVFDPSSTLNGNKGDNGGRGGDAGTVDVRIGHLAPGAALTLQSDGGNGGNGVQGQPGAKGGKGGAGHYYAPALTDPNGVGDFYDPASGGAGGWGGRGGDGGDAGDGGEVGGITVSVLQGDATGISFERTPGTAGTPGSDGKGHGAPGGAPGDSGWMPNASGDGYSFPDRPGVQGASGLPGKQGHQTDPSTIPRITPAAQCDAKLIVTQLPASLLGYLTMQVDRLRADLLMAGAPGAPQDDDFTDRIGWLSTLFDSYTPTVGEFDAFDALRADAETLTRQYNQGLDYFGNAQNYAPLGSFNSHQQEFDKIVPRLQAAQDDLDTLGQQLDTTASQSAQLAAGRARLEARIQDLDPEIDGLLATINDLVTRVQSSDDAAIAAKQEVVKSDTTTFSDSISSAMGLDADSFLDALGQFSFIGEKAPQAIAMVVSQVGKLVADGTSRVIADDGQSVPKQYVLEQLKDATTDAAFQSQLADKTPNQAVLRAVAQQKQIDDICDKFLSYPGADDLRQAFQDYVDALQARNNDIVLLNQAAATRQNLVVRRARVASAATTDAAQLAALSDPGAATMASQLARIVTQYKEDCIQQLYLAGRAYWFWSLGSSNIVGTELSQIAVGSPLPLTSKVLDSVMQSVYVALGADVETRLQDPTEWVPPSNAKRDARGVHLTFGPNSKVVHALRAGKEAVFSIPPARPKPHADPSNPFLGFGDVRLAKVRPWVFGATTKDNMLRVDIQHHGHDTVVDPTGAYTVVNHEPLSVTFRYDMSKGVNTPAAIYDGTNGPIDGDVRSPDADPMSALIGPFTRWTVDIPAAYNHGLDVSKIDKLTIEFFVHQRGFPV